MGQTMIEKLTESLTNVCAELWRNFMSAQQTAIRTTLRGSYKVVDVSENITAQENPASGTEVDVIYNNLADSEVSVTILSENYRTPFGNNIVMIIPVGGYCEANYSNIGGVIYVRGM